MLDPILLTFLQIREIEPLFRDRIADGWAEADGIEALQIVHGVGPAGCVGQGPETQPECFFGRQRIYYVLDPVFNNFCPLTSPVHEQSVGEGGGGLLVRELVERRPAAD
jgi:hypothetical protein